MTLKHGTEIVCSDETSCTPCVDTICCQGPILPAVISGLCQSWIWLLINKLSELELKQSGKLVP